jgi:hypothetical protein
MILHELVIFFHPPREPVSHTPESLNVYQASVWSLSLPLPHLTQAMVS